MMLNWWLGKPMDGTSRVEDEQDPPETPAPVFAARAFKSAIFGTPAQPDDTAYGIDKQAEEIGEGGEQEVGGDMTDPKDRTGSPTKPPGILLTPGTATTRRKTVSFGNEVVDNEVKNGVGKSGIPSNCPGKFPSPWSAKSESKTARKTALTRTLEGAREGKTVKTGVGKSSLRNEVVNSEENVEGTETEGSKRSKEASSSPQKGNQDSMRELATRDDIDADMTLDLNEPHSQSGKYWKSEYDQYHEQAKTEMKKLLKYKQLAKSYAKKKDAEAIDLGEKLKEERRKVLSMEEKISEIGALIAASGTKGVDDNSPELMNELARQTALTLQYKTLVDEFQDAYQGSQAHTNEAVSRKRFASPRTEQTLLETQQELKKARERLRDMENLRNETHSLRLTLSAAERKCTKLQDENSRLIQDLKRANMQVEREEKRRQIMEDQRERRDGAFQALQDDYDRLKDLGKKARQDDQELLKKRQDQVKELKKIVLAAQQELRISQQTIGQYKAAEEARIAEQRFFEPSPGKEARPKPERTATQQPEPSTRLSVRRENSRSRDSTLPVWSQSAASPSKKFTEARNTRSDTPLDSPGPQPSHAALSEVVNSANSDPNKKKPGTPGLTPFVNRFSNMTLESPLPSPEPSLITHPASRFIEDKARPSPRPSMFNIPSSPPRAIVHRPRTNLGLSRQKSTTDLAARAGALSRQKSTGDISAKAGESSLRKLSADLAGRQQTNMGSSRISSSDGSRIRNPLPPERAAAAKARLEQRMLEKKSKKAKEKELGKENIR